ncbi:DUF5665 domain-containing protein [Alkalihalobacillus pseudalcaliphilus]|uniref:DUF5665 domain-containing protein n=1 Tax=Alkalihalobacillus pseudalcaliphilus TaxID=79884 RepID=UPI00064DC160|nr:DUF5665 domain-containing protein [Alkalihalobacillus pseudalcaliphilus]KMK77310.1 hypothetical protein AB990_07115 [Alkalihalobacillus pseudalcaliphilus]
MGLSPEQERRKVPPTYREDEKRHEDNERFEKVVEKLEAMTTNGLLKDMAYHFSDKKEVIKVNLIAGISRGVGLTLGTAIFIGIFLFILLQMSSWPVVGQWVAEFLNMVETYRAQL